MALVPGDAFGEADGLRISYASLYEDLEEGLIRLERFLLSLS